MRSTSDSMCGTKSHLAGMKNLAKSQQVHEMADRQNFRSQM